MSKENLVTVSVPGVQEEGKPTAKHPKNVEIGDKITWYGPNVLIEQEDAKTLKEGDAVTLINWGNVKVEKIVVDEKSGLIKHIDTVGDFENKVGEKNEPTIFFRL